MRSTKKMTTAPTFFGERNHSGDTGDATVIFRTKGKVSNVQSESDQYSQVNTVFDSNRLLKQHLDSEYLLVNIYNSGDVEFIGKSLSLHHTLRLEIEDNQNNKADKREKVAMETLDQEHREQAHVDEPDSRRAACMIL